MMKIVRIGLFIVVFAVGWGSAWAETVYVKYRGPVPLDSFNCPPIKSSSFVRRICYDRANSYLIVQLKSTYYHYCDIDSGTVAVWRSAPSLGRFYNQYIKGGAFDCRGRFVPTYWIMVLHHLICIIGVLLVLGSNTLALKYWEGVEWEISLDLQPFGSRQLGCVWAGYFTRLHSPSTCRFYSQTPLGLAFIERF